MVPVNEILSQSFSVQLENLGRIVLTEQTSPSAEAGFARLVLDKSNDKIINDLPAVPWPTQSSLHQAPSVKREKGRK